MITLVVKQEHEFIQDFKFESEKITSEPFADNFLGLYFDWNKQNNKIEHRVNYYVGVCWLKKNETVLQVIPKIERLNYLKIFSECLSNYTVARHFNDSYKIYFNQPLIEIDSKNFEITPLLIVHFLSVVKRISQKGLKKGYVTITENLTGKIKGKIKVHQTIRKNLSENRADRNICQYQIHTQDCLENRLLKTALQQVSRYIHRYFVESNDNKKDLIKLLKYNQFSFESISEIVVSFNDFKKIKHSSFYAEYKEALKLAEMIFKRLGFNHQQNEKQIKCKTPPFYINMPELFERYVEVKLRKKYPDLLAGYGRNGDSETRSKTWGLRPDFLLPSMIIDAKYKVWYEKKTDIDFKDNFQQLSLYSRISDILEKVKSKKPKLVFIYPLKEGSTEFDLEILPDPEEGFEQIYKVAISLPTM